MSAQNGVTAEHHIPNDVPEGLLLDKVKLKDADAPEKQEFFLLQWLARVDRDLQIVDATILKKAQPYLQETLLNLVESTTPKPRRPIRRLIPRCFNTLFQRGETRTLFDTIVRLHGVASNKSNEKENKAAAIHCIGAVLELHGPKILSLFAETVAIFIKVIKSASKDLLVRSETYNAFTMVIRGAGKAANEALVKDILKCLRNGLADKALVVRIAAAQASQCMQVVFQTIPQPATAVDVEQHFSYILRALDPSSAASRQACGQLCGTIAAQSQSAAAPISSKDTSKKVADAAKDEDTNVNGAVGHSPKAWMTLDEMLDILQTNYNRLGTSRETKTVIIEAYAGMLEELGTTFVETNYKSLIRHFFIHIISNNKNIQTQYDQLFTRRHIEYLVQEVMGRKLLNEHGQLTALRTLANEWIKKWPAVMPNESAPNEFILVVALNCASALLWDLGEACKEVTPIYAEPLLKLLDHHVHSVHVSAAWCLKSLCLSSPTALSSLLPKALELTDKAAAQLDTNDGSDAAISRATGRALGVAAMMSVVPHRPLQVSFDVTGRAFSISTRLMGNVSKESRIGCAQTQIAWMLISGLMTLGPNLVKLHLPQILLSWKTALPKPTGKEAHSLKSDAEWYTFLHIRESVIGSIYSFLLHNSNSLVTIDIAKRITALLNNTLAFLTTTPANLADHSAPSADSTINLSNLNLRVRKRILQCFVLIQPVAVFDNLYSSLSRMCIGALIDPEKNISRTMQTSVSATAAPGAYTPVWTLADGYGNGVTSLMQGYKVNIGQEASEGKDSAMFDRTWMACSVFQPLEELLEMPTIPSMEFDDMSLCFDIDESRGTLYATPDVPNTAIQYVNSCVELLSIIFAAQSSPSQESLLDQVQKSLKETSSQKHSHKRMAMMINLTVALLGALRHTVHSNSRRTDIIQFSIAPGKAMTIMEDIFKEALVHPDAYLRSAASEAIGLLASIGGSHAMAKDIQFFVDQIVNNRDPDARAGSALALGNIYANVGGMSANTHLKTIMGILMSLSADPHPVVHTWALESLAVTISASGPMFSGYANNTLGMVGRLYLAESHEPAAGSIATSNAGAKIGFSAYQEFGRILYAIIGTIGPELQTSNKGRDLCLDLIEGLKREPWPEIVMEAIRCTQQMLMFSPADIAVADLTQFLQLQLVKPHFQLQKAAITCLYQLVQRDVKQVFNAATGRIEELLFNLLNTEPALTDVTNVIQSWLKQTAFDEPTVWVNICKKVMTGSATDPNASTTFRRNSNEDFDDFNGFTGDESDGFSDDDVFESEVDVPTAVQDATEMVEPLINVEMPSKWRTQLFALQCLHQMVLQISSGSKREHLDLIFARQKRQHDGVGDYLVFRLADLIKLAFTAATNTIDKLRLEGIGLLKDITFMYASTADPDVEGASLLEQYSAQIAAALTPAFAEDSSSEVVSSAVKVCAVYVGSGIVDELYRLGRILKLLTMALDRCKPGAERKLGDVVPVSPQASIMVNLSILDAWAELQIASTSKSYLLSVVEPHLDILCPLWLSALQQYARLRTESDFSSMPTGNAFAEVGGTGTLNTMYSAAIKDVIQPFYRRSWLRIVGAVASLLDKHNSSMQNAMQQQAEASNISTSQIDFVLLGLCLEHTSRHSASVSSHTTLDVSNMAIALQALRTFLLAPQEGEPIINKAVFLEVINVFDRFIQTEGTSLQYIIMDILLDICNSPLKSFLEEDVQGKGQDEGNDSAQLEKVLDGNAFPASSMVFYMLRLIIGVLSQHLTWLSDKVQHVRSKPRAADGTRVTDLCMKCIDGLNGILGLLPAALRMDCFAIILYINTAILRDTSTSDRLAGHVLVALKAALAKVTSNEEESPDICNAIVDQTTQLLLTTGDDCVAGDIGLYSMTKNCVLASTLIFSSFPRSATRSPVLQHRFTKMIQDILSSACPLDVTQIALQCCNTLMLRSKVAIIPASEQFSRVAISLLLPVLLSFMASLKHSTRPSREVMLLLDDVFGSIKLLLSTLGVHEETGLLRIVLPVCTVLLDDPPMRPSPSKMHQHVVPLLLNIAAEHSVEFKQVLAHLPSETRSKLESAFRSAVSSQQPSAEPQKDARREKDPTIQLKSDFSNFE